MLPESIIGPDGTRYYTPASAGRRIGKTARQVDTLVTGSADDPTTALRSTRDPALVSLHRGRGRPPGYLVLADDVERMRTELLHLLGVDDEISALRSELVEVRAAWEREVLPLRTRLSQLEEEKVAILNAVEKRLDAAITQADADREFLRALRTSTTGPQVT